MRTDHVPPYLGRPGPRRRERRRSLLTALPLAIVLWLGASFAGLSGCDEAALDGRIHLRFWNGFTGPDGRTMLAIVKEFNRQNPDIRVTMQRMDWATYYSKLFVAGLGGRAPEVFVVHTDQLARFRYADFVRPVDDLMNGAIAVDPANLTESAWEAVASDDGRHYALPLDVHALGMYYNVDLLKQAGVVDAQGNPAPPRTREEFLTALEKIQARSGRADTWGFVYTWLRTNFYMMLRQFGGDILSEDHTQATLDTPEAIRAMEFAVSLVKRGLVPPPQDFDSWVGFRQGKVGIVFEGIYMLPDLEKQKNLNWAAAPVPLFGDQKATWGGSHNLVLRAGLTDEELDAATRFLTFLSDSSLDWAEGGQIPARVDLLETERFQSMPAQAAFAEQLPYVQFMPSVPFIDEYLSHFDLALEKALRGQATPQQALQEADRNIQSVIDRYRRAEEEREAREMTQSPDKDTQPDAQGALQEAL